MLIRIDDTVVVLSGDDKGKNAKKRRHRRNSKNKEAQWHAERMGQLLPNRGREVRIGKDWPMDEKENQNVVLETVETNQNQIQEAHAVWNPEAESVGICEHQKRLLENLQ